MLNKDDWRRVQTEFDRISQAPPETWANEVSHSGLPDPLKQTCSAMLQGLGMSGVLDRPRMSESSDYRSIAEGTKIGKFSIGRLIGRGGSGEVYEATRRAGDGEQRAALKILRPESAGESVAFDRECRLLATLEHAGITRLIESGMTPDGRPFLATEFVEGAAITDHCEKASLDLAARLNLFCDVCDAVSYAHGRMVIHRDIKPSNVLVSHDGRVKLLDFGIARLIQPDAGPEAVSRVLATPQYAAPEQFEGGAEGATTDVYALGILLFELVTGSSPWAGSESNLPAVLRRVMQGDVPPPSTTGRLVNLPPRQLRGDIDAIVARATARTPSDRYASVAALRGDLISHLNLRPVAARSGQTAYAAGRFLRRRRWSVAFVSAAAVSILALGAGIALQARQTAVERDVALAEARRTSAVNQALTVMFRDARGRGPADSVSVRAMLDDTAGRLAGSLDDSPQSIELLKTFADLYVMIEEQRPVEPFLEKALARGIGASDPLGHAELAYRLAASKIQLGKLEDARALIDPAVETFASAPASYRKQRIEALAVKASLARATGDLDTAIKIYNDTMEEAEQVFADDPREILTRYNNLLVFLNEANRGAEVEPVLARAEAAVAKFGQERTQQGFQVRLAKGTLLSRTGRYAEAEAHLEQLMDDRKALEGESVGYAATMLQVARVELARDKAAEALPRLEAALPIVREKTGPSSPITLFVEFSRLEAMERLGNTAAARARLAEIESGLDPAATPAMIRGLAHRLKGIWAFRAGDRALSEREFDSARRAYQDAQSQGAAFIDELDSLRARLAQQAVPQ